MDQVANLLDRERRDLFSETAARMGIQPAVVEKDFWVVWVLDRLFASELLAGKILFKGGTSLPKAVFAGGGARLLSELAGEVVAVVEAGIEGDFSDVQGGVLQ